jgi:hypothetical protein
MQRLLSGAQLTIAQSIVSSAREAEVLADPIGAVDQNALLTAGFAAITSLRRNQAGVLAQTSSLLLRGLSIADTAKLVQQYFSPWFATRRDVTGRQVRAGRVGLVKSWPGEAGMASQRARLLMLNATSEAHTRGMRRRGRREQRLLRYTLSLKHVDRDACDENARRDVGFGPGLYLADDAPSVPVTTTVGATTRRPRRCRSRLSRRRSPAGIAGFRFHESERGW